MQYVSSSHLPVQILSEIAFWKNQEKEHAGFILQLAPALEERYVKLLQEWTVVFLATEQAALQLLGIIQSSAAGGPGNLAAETDQLRLAACGQSSEFIRQLRMLLEADGAAGVFPAGGALLEHFIRESEYLLAVLSALSAARQETGGLQENLLENNDSSKETAAQQLPLWESRDPESVPIGGHTLPPLPYAYNALEPYIDEKTMIIHHDKHHQSYVDGLNKAENKLAEARRNNDYDLVKHWERELAFNGAGHYLHTIFWNVMSPQGGGRPAGALLDAIQRSFGSYEAFKAQFTEAANKVEGGGWAILVWSPRSRRLEILTAEKHQNLSQWDIVPLLVLDVWEHAYYLKHQNNRADYIRDWWKVVNWPYVAERYNAARKLVWQPF
ncbi:Fe-Mn family superoxide dismutase [Paenibacillus sp. MMS20-IR301]|uniref:Fe-Mn family superoxide dismutase n=1 Tax=Paenibacillus sp. MMS20-IR301 TaxID=2895946 RepID=UPI0028E3A32A|nr:Fe-Mn family superoxide dismutase [Paenibacillus sp. MMS20-IR301]WNS41658.1 Fe-Mn family superoxide dismutase [Paenibacillus sp. MMS20-IR301]